MENMLLTWERIETSSAGPVAGTWQRGTSPFRGGLYVDTQRAHSCQRTKPHTTRSNRLNTSQEFTVIKNPMLSINMLLLFLACWQLVSLILFIVCKWVTAEHLARVDLKLLLFTNAKLLAMKLRS